MSKRENLDLTPATSEAAKPPCQATTTRPLKVKVAGGKAGLEIATPENLANLFAATGSADNDFASVLIEQLLYATSFVGSQDQDAKIETRTNAVLAAMSELRPQDPIEGMIAAQLVAVHGHAMHFLKLSTIPDNMVQPEILRRIIGLSTRLSRTYTQLVETLVRYRRKAEQTVRVEHVSIYQGGQAVVGHVEHHPVHGGAHEK